MRTKITHSRYQKGQALAEHIILWPLLLLLTLGSVQMALLYRAKSTFNDATFRAAREGALNNAFKEPMRVKLAEAMAPLYLKRNPGIAGYAQAVARSRLLNTAVPPNMGGARIDIISPTQEIFTRFARRTYVLEPCSGRGCGNSRFREARTQLLQVPNDNLNVRSAATQRLTSGGQTIDINLQDANLLKIRAYWCYPMEVPVVNLVIYQAMNAFGRTRSPHWRACQVKTLASQLAGGWRYYYLPIESHSIMRMQSPVRCEGSATGRNCRNFQT